MTRLITILLSVLLSSCSSSYLNISSDTHISELATLYTYSEGQRGGTIYTVMLDSINGKNLIGKSKRWLYLKPGEYEIEVTSSSYNEGSFIAGAIAGGMVSGSLGGSPDTGAIVASSEATAEMERTRIDDDNIKIQLEAGNIYVIDPVIENKQIKYFEVKTY